MVKVESKMVSKDRSVEQGWTQNVLWKSKYRVKQIILFLGG